MLKRLTLFSMNPSHKTCNQLLLTEPYSPSPRGRGRGEGQGEAGKALAHPMLPYAEVKTAVAACHIVSAGQPRSSHLIQTETPAGDRAERRMESSRDS
jgi:hypothetical protein